MDTEIVQYILQNRRENKLMSRVEIEEEKKMKVVDIYGEFIDFETNKENVYQTLDKLQNYRYCKTIKDIDKGNYIRYLNAKYFYDIKLNPGGFIENIDYKKKLVTLVNKNKYYKIKFIDNIIFVKLTEEDLLKLNIIEILEKN
jgi:hypothetical protein|tara:strand:+ start:164 stop:592 length:429 start_codon:yes stop_codon:yes gene_type:complete